MGIIDEVVKMQKEGRSDEEIFADLQKRGLSPQDVSNAFTQISIKEAVVNNPQESMATEKQQVTEEIEAMQPSMLNQDSQDPSAPNPIEAGQEYSQQYSQQQYQDYPYPQYQSQSLSSDTINEIAEQVVAEKISPLRSELEKSIDLKNTLNTKFDYLDERLKRIEKIIDRLQLSILQKVGDYVTNVEDIKKELVETQKSFKSLAQKKHHSK